MKSWDIHPSANSQRDEFALAGFFYYIAIAPYYLANNTVCLTLLVSAMRFDNMETGITQKITRQSRIKVPNIEVENILFKSSDESIVKKNKTDLEAESDDDEETVELKRLLTAKLDEKKRKKEITQRAANLLSNDENLFEEFLAFKRMRDRRD